ncbi:unnamed protein product [Moneuplotes crassus]|uniref:RING-type domain-containing protein n=1 Tax=Euplotes crassus TaxID=5936 RepID=A0AAD1UNQ7_EUPCR|nr:unnamed protein product [Moneuplotes crassus]
MEDREPKGLDEGEEQRREGGFLEERSRGNIVYEEEKQRIGCHSAQGCKRGSSKGEGDEGDFDCSICITSFDGNDTKAIPLLKEKLKSSQKEQSNIADAESPESPNSEDIAILYFNHSDKNKNESGLDSKMNLSSMVPKDTIGVVRQRDIEDNLEEILVNFETNGVSILFNCSHIFHKHCIKDWIKGHNTCPVCREKIYQKEVEKSYLDELDYQDSQMNFFGFIADSLTYYYHTPSELTLIDGVDANSDLNTFIFSNLVNGEDEPSPNTLNLEFFPLIEDGHNPNNNEQEYQVQ